MVCRERVETRFPRAYAWSSLGRAAASILIAAPPQVVSSATIRAINPGRTTMGRKDKGGKKIKKPKQDKAKKGLAAK